MNKIKNHSKELIILTILLAVAVSVVNAAVFVYYPIDIAASWSGRPVYFQTGTNANGPDIGGTITVQLSDEGTDVDITVYPSSRGTVRYRDILRVVNGDSKAYYVGITVSTPFGTPTTADLILRNSTHTFTVDLKSGGVTWVPWVLAAGGSFQVDLRFKFQGGSGSETASIYLVYSPQSTEQPSTSP